LVSFCDDGFRIRSVKYALYLDQQANTNAYTKDQYHNRYQIKFHGAPITFFLFWSFAANNSEYVQGWPTAQQPNNVVEADHNKHRSEKIQCASQHPVFLQLFMPICGFRRRYCELAQTFTG
jgi:hypothetical protein